MEQGNGISDVAWLVWLAGAGCDGCTMSLLGAAEPGLEDLLGGNLPDVPRLVLIHSQFGPHFFSQFKTPSKSILSDLPWEETNWLPGEPYEAMLRRAAAGESPPFVLVVEGGVYTPPRSGGSFSQFGLTRKKQPMTMASWLEALAPRAEAVLALGSCASFGGIPAAAGGIGEVKGVEEFLGHGFQSRSGLPVLHLPGCAPPGEGMIETLVYVFLHLAQLVPLDLDAAHRPRWLYNKEIYPLPPHTAEPPTIAEEAGQTLPVLCAVPALGWTRGVGGCTRVGGGCIACTERGFADQHLHTARTDTESSG